MTRSSARENIEMGDGGSAGLASCLYECEVVHQRHAPRPHRFRHQMFQFYLDLDGLDGLSQRLRLFSRNRFNLYNLRESDFLDRETCAAPRPLKERLLEWLAAAGVAPSAVGRVFLLTLPRVAGCSFVPVSFYVCLGAENAPVCCVAEVHNTFGEIKLYLIPPAGSPADAPQFRARIDKNFYVSPFSKVTDQFDFRVSLPAGRFEIQVDDLQDGMTILTSRFSGQRLPLTDRVLLALTLRHPLVTLHAVAAIHWQALRLRAKRIPWFPKIAAPERQAGVLRPCIPAAAEAPGAGAIPKPWIRHP